MLTVEILNNLDLNNDDDIKLLEKVEKENKEFYDYLINSFQIINIIQVLKDKKKMLFTFRISHWGDRW